MHADATVVTAAPSRWIRTTEEVRALAERLHGASSIALDTEADSLHHYPARLCLLQLGEASGQAWLVDPLAPLDLGPLDVLFADPAVLTVVHAGDNDLAALKRGFGLAFNALFDTYIAARFLGVTELGLEALLARYLGVSTGPSRQKDDWSVRPLTPEQEAYALDDVRHLIPLKDRLVAELEARGRGAWVREECEALARLRPVESIGDPDAYLAIKGARALPPRSLAVLRELHRLRESLARQADRPPFKVLGTETLLAIAQSRPRSAAELGAIRGCTALVVGRHGAAILAAVARGEAVGEEALPAVPRRPRPTVPPAVRRRVEALRAWRAGAARQLDLDPGVLLPGRLIDRIAEAAPGDPDTLARIEGVRRWRVVEFGDEIVAALSGGAADRLLAAGRDPA